MSAAASVGFHSQFYFPEGIRMANLLKLSQFSDGELTKLRRRRQRQRQRQRQKAIVLVS